MFQSQGVLKSDIVRWQGTIKDWSGNLIHPGAWWAPYADLYRSQLWVNVVIDKRAKAAARLPFKVYQRGDDDARTSGAGSPFGRLMAHPSKSIDPFLFWTWTQSTKDIHGEAFWLKVRDAQGRPIDLLPVHPTKVLSDTDDKTGRTKWSIQLLASGKSIDVVRRDLVHFREFNPTTTLRGLSKLEPLRATLENEDGARRANSALWRNGGRPSVVLQHPQLLNPDALKRLSAQWSEIHGSVDNWAKAAILEEGMTANVIPLNVEELQYIEARKLNREEVCAAYDMAPPVVHILDRATFSNITEQHRSMYRDTMGTVLGSLESTVEYELRDGRFGADVEPDFGDAFYGEFLLDEVLRGAFEARATAYQQADYMTIAEKRQKENLPFIAGTDQIFLNSATLPLGADGYLQTPAGDAAPEASEAEQIAIMLQKIYLAVGPVITSDEARELVNRAGAGLVGQLPPKPAAIPLGEISHVPMRSVMGRLGRTKSVADIDPVALVAGLEGDAVGVLKHLVAARLEGDSLDEFKARLRTHSKEQQ